MTSGYVSDPRWIAAQRAYLADYPDPATASATRSAAIDVMHAVEAEHRAETEEPAGGNRRAWSKGAVE